MTPQDSEARREILSNYDAMAIFFGSAAWWETVPRKERDE